MAGCGLARESPMGGGAVGPGRAPEMQLGYTAQLPRPHHQRAGAAAQVALPKAWRST